ncbi:hypothetical protein F2Q70_00043434 [Brassica cretica]|uniref:Uncharacterized protein n=1 Tax=Brassica cretica TaxID=69181 RepID=A0A8S9KJ50_BRACR|nr:hypothetical protein F2Q70_00043434 [Brassica cretica]
MLEVANELAAGSFDFDHLSVNLDADALGDVHRLGRKDHASAAITTFTKLQPPYAVLLHPRQHLLSSPPSSLSLSLPSSTARYHQVIKPSRSATIIRSRASLIRLNTEREDRGDLSVGEVCVGIEGSGGGNERLSGGNERLGGGGGDELRGGVRKQVSESWSSYP